MDVPNALGANADPPPNMDAVDVAAVDGAEAIPRRTRLFQSLIPNITKHLPAPPNTEEPPNSDPPATGEAADCPKTLPVGAPNELCAKIDPVAEPPNGLPADGAAAIEPPPNIDPPPPPNTFVVAALPSGGEPNTFVEALPPPNTD